MRKIIASALLALVLAGCAGVTKMHGEQVVNQRLVVKVDEAWNRIDLPGNQQPYEMWTQEGLSLDHLRFWAAVKPGQPLMAVLPGSVPMGQTAPRVPTFTQNMAADQLVSLFEVLYAADGSLVTVTKIEPTQFAANRGLRFEFTVARKRDDLPLRGVGWIAVRNDELYAATFVAPRLTFFPRLLPKAESVVATARIRG